MRCSKCNVDLGEEYKRCPLCSGETSPEEARLTGFVTAEYPDVKYHPHPLPVKKMCAVFFVIASAAALVTDRLVNGQLSNAALIICCMLAVWGLFVRQLTVREQTAGDRVSKALVYSAPLMICLSRNGYVKSSVMWGAVAPCAVLLACFILGAYMLSRKSKRQRVMGVTHVAVYAVFGATIIIASQIVGIGFTVLEAAAVIAALGLLAVIAASSPEEFMTELRSKFFA